MTFSHFRALVIEHCRQTVACYDADDPRLARCLYVETPDGVDTVPIGDELWRADTVDELFDCLMVDVLAAMDARRVAFVRRTVLAVSTRSGDVFDLDCLLIDVADDRDGAMLIAPIEDRVDCFGLGRPIRRPVRDANYRFMAGAERYFTSVRAAAR